MPLVTVDTLPVREIFPGIRARLIHTDRVTHSWVEVDAGATFPEHQHPHEQIVTVLEGELELVVEGKVHRLKHGTVFVIPSNARHSGGGITTCPCARRLQVASSTLHASHGNSETLKHGKRFSKCTSKSIFCGSVIL
jgi:unsaturated pyranuronate lyase